MADRVGPPIIQLQPRTPRAGSECQRVGQHSGQSKSHIQPPAGQFPPQHGQIDRWTQSQQRHHRSGLPTPSPTVEMPAAVAMAPRVMIVPDIRRGTSAMPQTIGNAARRIAWPGMPSPAKTRPRPPWPAIRPTAKLPIRQPSDNRSEFQEA